VISSQVAREANVALQAVVQSGTGTGAALYSRPVAGKTGTTNNNVDAWFNGFTPQLETTVWMGNVAAEVPMRDVGGVGQVYGGTFPAHTWHDFMAQVLASAPVDPFAPPNYGDLPSPKFITSPALVRDDALDHNFGFTTPLPNTSTTTGPLNSTPPTVPNTPTTAPGRRSPPTTVAAPSTTAPATTPTSVKRHP
jgi:membrane peptidoglycan carboxypeptidase